MKSALEVVEIALLMGLTFSFALLIEWAALQLFFSAIAFGLRPAVSTAQVRGTQNATLRRAAGRG